MPDRHDDKQIHFGSKSTDQSGNEQAEVPSLILNNSVTPRYHFKTGSSFSGSFDRDPFGLGSWHWVQILVFQIDLEGYLRPSWGSCLPGMPFRPQFASPNRSFPISGFLTSGIVRVSLIRLFEK
jgi:hypothetical protein